MIQVIVLSLALLGLASSVSAQVSASPLAELDKQYEAALNARDAAKVAALFAEDAVYVPPGMAALSGPKAIQEHHATIFKEMPVFDATNTPMASELSGDLGLVLGEFVLRDRSSKDEFKGKYLRVWKRVNGAVEDSSTTSSTRRAPTPPDAADPSDAANTAAVAARAGHARPSFIRR